MKLKHYKEVTVTLDGLPTMDDILSAITSLRERADKEFGQGDYIEETHFCDRHNARQGFGTDTDQVCLLLRAVAKGA